MRSVMFVSAFALLLGSAAYAQDHGQVVTPDSIKWGPVPPVLPKGGEAAVLHGDPEKAGAVVMRIKMPAGYKIAAHHHPTDENVTVISGTFLVGMGDKLDEAKAQKLGTGGFVALPANMNHYAMAGAETIVQVNTTGPFAITYVNPADDPSKKTQSSRQPGSGKSAAQRHDPLLAAETLRFGRSNSSAACLLRLRRRHQRSVLG